MGEVRKMTKKKIGIIITTVLLASILAVFGIFLANMLSFQKKLKRSLAVSQINITCESKYYHDEKEADETEYTLAPIGMYYAKNGDGYNVKCGDFIIYDTMLYHNSIGPSLGSGSKAELTAEDTVKEYKSYFENVTRRLSEDAYSAPIYNLAAVGKALKEHKTLFTFKSVNGKETAYKLYFGKDFYKDVIKAVQGGDLIDFNKPMQYPVVVKFTENKLSRVSIRISATLDFDPWNTRIGERIFDYNVYYDYDTPYAPTEEEKDKPYALYQSYRPKKILQLSSSSLREAEYHNGKLYVILPEYQDDRYTLEIYDLKTGGLLKKVDLPKNAYNPLGIVLHGDCVYVPVDPDAKNMLFCYNEKTETTTLYDIPALQVFFVSDEIVVVENGRKISCGGDWDSLVETDKYDDCSSFYYDNHSGNAYARKQTGEKEYLVKLTKEGVSENKIELKFQPNNQNFSYGYTQDGITVCQKTVDEKGRCIKSEYTHYNFGLEWIKKHEVEKYDGTYVGETEEYVFYSTFLLDKEKGRYYAFDKIDAYHRYAIFDGVLYCCYNGEVFSSQELETEDRY